MSASSNEEGVSRPYLVMPLLPGVTLDKLIRASSQRLTVERSIDIACQACRGLQAAHEKGLVHRDIKPSNIFVLEDDSIKIIDFGVAHRMEASRTVGRKGTLLYHGARADRDEAGFRGFRHLLPGRGLSTKC